MYIQIQNKSLEKYNTVMVEVSDDKQVAKTIGSKVKEMGWKLADCISSQIRKELIEAKYRGVDGKNIPAGRRQYKARAKKTGTLNRVK